MNERQPALDGLRAIAVLAVILYHCGVFPIGWAGVDLFFVLSGFLITGILLDAKAASPSLREYWVPFYMRRTLRIMPLALTTMFLVMIVLPRISWYPKMAWSEQVWYWTFTSNFVHASSVTAQKLRHFWTLAVEEQFYLAWPWIVFAVAPRRLLRLCLILAAVAIAGRIAVSAFGWQAPLSRLGTRLIVFRMDGLVLGAFLATWSRIREVRVRWAGMAAAVALAAFGLMASGRSDASIGSAPAWIYATQYTILAVGCTALTLYALTDRPAWLRWRPLAFLGSISYGVYVIQAPATRAVEDVASGWLLVLLSLSIIIPLAWLSWRVLELPFLRLKRLWPMPSASKRAVRDKRGAYPVTQLAD